MSFNLNQRSTVEYSDTLLDSISHRDRILDESSQTLPWDYYRVARRPAAAWPSKNRASILSHHTARAFDNASLKNEDAALFREQIRSTRCSSPESFFAVRGRCRPRVCASWERSSSSLSLWKASLPARDCRASMKTMTCCRRWRGNWSKGMVLAKPPTPSGEPSTQNIRSCFQRPLVANEDVPLIEASATLPGAQLDPAAVVEEAIAGSSVLVFGQRRASLSGKRSRARSAVPEQASLFGFS